jgi:hypothetical protein
MNHQLTITVHPELYAICKLRASDELPAWAAGEEFVAISRTKRELSIVCDDSRVPEEMHAERKRRLMQVEGTLPFSLTGVLAAIAVPLADANVSIFAVSTFDTDYLLISDNDLQNAISALEAAGHVVRRENSK